MPLNTPLKKRDRFLRVVGTMRSLTPRYKTRRGIEWSNDVQGIPEATKEIGFAMRAALEPRSIWQKDRSECHIEITTRLILIAHRRQDLRYNKNLRLRF
jgi:hypothetical protein